MKKIFFLFTFLFCLHSFSQKEDAWLFLKNKPNKAAFLASPLTMLSQRALDRRNNHNIALDSIDVPLDVNYYNQLKSESTITILGKSKWLNAVHIQGEIIAITNLLANYNFIDRVEFANKTLNSASKFSAKNKKTISNHTNKFSNNLTDFNYGSADNQIKMLKGDYLHEQGLTGEGQIIAIIDAGFPNVNTLPAFQRIRDNNQILGGYNFADRDDDFYKRSSHGTHVLSTIAGYLENEFVGTAPDAEFYLFITEITETETVLEETLWVEAAERADSLGVNVINTSLGYTTYDNPNHSHTYADMDGKTTFISRGAEIGASRGLILVNSAGNSGSNPWKYIGSPADAPSVISVGAADASGNIASFSSFGPTADGRVKPEIIGQGQNPVTINYISGAITNSSSGTSFSGPIMAGLIACLNQNESFLLKSAKSKNVNNAKNFNDYLKEAVYESADKFDNPLDQYGYGIPNFEVALNNYIATLSVDENFLEAINLYPNPVESTFTINGLDEEFGLYKLEIFNFLGKTVYQQEQILAKEINISFLESGIYLVKIKKGNQHKTLKLIKQ